MATLTECDRCRSAGRDGFRKLRFGVASLEKFKVDGPVSEMDLCKSCWNGLVDWLKPLPTQYRKEEER